MKDTTLLYSDFIRTHPREAARILEGLAVKDTVSFLRGLSPSLVALLLATMNPATAADAMIRMGPSRVARSLTYLPTEQLSRILRFVPDSFFERLSAELPPGVLTVVDRQRGFPPNTVGAHMETSVPVVRNDISLRQAYRFLKKYPNPVSSGVFVLDVQDRLVGILEPVDILRGNGGAEVSSVCRWNPPTLSPFQDISAADEHPGWREYVVLPVVTREGTFLGALRRGVVEARAGMGEAAPRSAAGGTASSALGELFSLGLSGLLKSLAYMAREASPTREDAS